MGQRHQAYLRVPKVYYNENNPNNRPEETRGLHHQWLYGWNAVHALYRYLHWFMKGELAQKYFSQYEQEPFNYAYSFDHEIGYSHGVHTLSKQEANDPMLGDNNNGITIIDMADLANPKYCFMFIGPQETCVKPMPDFVPISAEEWLTCHYPEWRESGEGSPDAFKLDRLGYINKHAQLLTKERIELIFPKMMVQA